MFSSDIRWLEENPKFSYSCHWTELPIVSFANSNFFIVTSCKTRPWRLATAQSCESQHRKRNVPHQSHSMNGGPNTQGKQGQGTLDHKVRKNFFQGFSWGLNQAYSQKKQHKKSCLVQLIEISFQHQLTSSRPNTGMTKAFCKTDF